MLSVFALEPSIKKTCGPETECGMKKFPPASLMPMVGQVASALLDAHPGQRVVLFISHLSHQYGLPWRLNGQGHLSRPCCGTSFDFGDSPYFYWIGTHGGGACGCQGEKTCGA